MILVRIKLDAIPDFKKMVVAYWHELMPHSDLVKSHEGREIYFQERFSFENDSLNLFWAVEDGRKIGFVAFSVNEAKHSAMIEDFFVLPEFRRRGHGSAMVNALSSETDKLGVELIELTVRRDTPQALAFWEAQGFRIALHCLRQYRDSKRGTAYIGALSSDFTCKMSDGATDNKV
jgi:ribosomal protein S18 acetylase RimI-like enzyme